MVVFNIELTQPTERFLESTRQVMNRHMLPESAQRLIVRLAEGGEAIGTIGAATGGWTGFSRSRKRPGPRNW